MGGRQLVACLITEIVNSAPPRSNYGVDFGLHCEAAGFLSASPGEVSASQALLGIGFSWRNALIKKKKINHCSVGKRKSP